MLPRSWRNVYSSGEPDSAIRAASASAAEANSLHPSVPASVAVRERSSLAPGLDGGSPSPFATVASTPASSRARRWCSSSSTLGTDRGPHQRGGDDRARARDLLVSRGVAGGQPQAAESGVEV